MRQHAGKVRARPDNRRLSHTCLASVSAIAARSRSNSSSSIHRAVIAMQDDPLTASQLLRELCADMYVSPLELEDMVGVCFGNEFPKSVTACLTRLSAGQRQEAFRWHSLIRHCCKRCKLRSFNLEFSTQLEHRGRCSARRLRSVKGPSR